MYTKKPLKILITITLLYFCSIFFANLLAFDVSPYKSGQVLTVEQAKTLQEKFNHREKQDWLAPKDKATIKGDNKEKILYGIKLLDKTAITIGPKVSDKSKRYSGNALNCSSCHLKGLTGLPGTAYGAIPFTNMVNDFPKFQGRTMQVTSMADRVNGCMTRSMGNGRAMPKDSDEMLSILAYFSWLAENTKKDLAMQGTGLPVISIPKRKADIVEGNTVYKQLCMACHGVNAQGTKSPDYAKNGTYLFPPLAGEDSFNNGAGMSRLKKATRFIHANMPLGTTYAKPSLTIDQAYDVAAYMLSLPRSERNNRDKDFPEKFFRPKDYPVPEYFDGDKDALEKAQFGPFN